MVLKKFICENGTQTKILIVCPPAIEGSWRETAVKFQIDNHFHYVTIGSLQQVLDPEKYEYKLPGADQYDVVVVDESHKFRNDSTGMYTALQTICKPRRARPGLGGDDRKKVLLISATPLNNGPEDIENQLYLFQDARSSTLDGTRRNLQESFKPVKEKGCISKHPMRWQ